MDERSKHLHWEWDDKFRGFRLLCGITETNHLIHQRSYGEEGKPGWYVWLHQYPGKHKGEHDQEGDFRTIEEAKKAAEECFIANTSVWFPLWEDGKG